ncbi:MAG: cytochrome c [Actinomycetota bacterium]|nr:cytochrome c [Actinomycetota bacterium]
MPVILAASTAQKLGTVFAIALVLGWVLFMLAHVKRGSVRPGDEIEQAPNRKPYFDDEALEGPKLERALTMALILLVIIGVGLPLYWLNETRRENGAKKLFANTAVEVGFSLFQPADSTQHANPKLNELHFGCAGCHGNVGQGAATNFTITSPLQTTQSVSWQVPALNTVLLKFTPDTVRTIIVYGRSNTPMPAWGLAGGGPMNDSQIDALIAYLESIQITPAEAKKAAAQYGNDGKAIFDAYCARCHTKGYSYGQPDTPGGGAYGPNLTGGDELRQFPNITEQLDYVSKGATYGKSYGTRGIGSMAADPRLDVETAGAAQQGGGMPKFDSVLSPEQIQAVVDYERGL